MITIISNKAIVEIPVGDGTRVWAFAHIQAGAIVGRNCNIGEHCFIETGAVIGDDVVIKNGVCIWSGIHVSDKVFIGPGAVLTNDPYPRSKVIVPEWQPTGCVLKEGCSIGANATVLAGVTVGEYAMLGAGAVATKDIPAYSICYGNPAEVRNYICKCSKKIKFIEMQASCTCGRQYIRYEKYKGNALVVCSKEI